jgi:cell division protein FtsB
MKCESCGELGGTHRAECVKNPNSIIRWQKLALEERDKNIVELEQKNAKLIVPRDNAILAECSYSPMDESCKGSESMRQENATLRAENATLRAKVERLNQFIDEDNCEDCGCKLTDFGEGIGKRCRPCDKDAQLTIAKRVLGELK